MRLWLVAQVFILDALVNYQVQDSKDAEKIVERVLPRLQHVNSAVVLSAAKVSGCALNNCD
jgi:AP-1 complex subunit beta-1